VLSLFGKLNVTPLTTRGMKSCDLDLCMSEGIDPKVTHEEVCKQLKLTLRFYFSYE
jgi:hypothetical protein